jgi:hypothetical protein
MIPSGSMRWPPPSDSLTNEKREKKSENGAFIIGKDCCAVTPINARDSTTQQSGCGTKSDHLAFLADSQSREENEDQPVPSKWQTEMGVTAHFPNWLGLTR